MHNRADQFGKSLLREALSAAAMPETEVEVVAARQTIDVYAVPDPARAAERPKMGLLGDLSTEPALFEPFRDTPSLARVRRCLRKQLTWHHELERRARTASAKAQDGVAPRVSPGVAFPWLVVISPGRPRTVIDIFSCRPARPGVYEAVAGIHMRVVVLRELPRERDTLLRLLGAGDLFEEALADVAALPSDAWEKGVVGPLVVLFRLASRRRRGRKENEVRNAEVQAWIENFKHELRQEGRVEGRAYSLLTVLRSRGIKVPDADRDRILAQEDPDRLERWLERALDATSLAEVLTEPS